MVKKLFALASVTGLSGLVIAVAAAGCSSTTTIPGDVPDTGATPTDSGKGKETTPPKGDDDDTTEAGPATCPSTDPVAAADLPWMPPTPTKVGACTQAQLDEFNKFLTDNPTTTNAQFIDHIKKSSPTTCGACVVTDAAAATWGPLPSSNGDLVTINIGSCFSLVSGKEACGKAIQNEFDCEFVACGDCTDDTAFDSCRTKSQKGACKPYVSGIATACNGVPATVDDACGSFFDSMRVQCVSLTADGGVDGGDAGN
jgi:hypothetical protein